ncbi:hypothetical protein GCM10017600_75820 [Streptosporangium carneum]|uniref:Uncharacterized protein n=1 Tax=Streptosporangium carneum TaxID=47481 RepID=A0A9W6MHH1_9ACTN|nr:hypothetical protein GCM10017600_75820 [Streptosporangium carneum]
MNPASADEKGGGEEECFMSRREPFGIPGDASPGPGDRFHASSPNIGVRSLRSGVHGRFRRPSDLTEVRGADSSRESASSRVSVTITPGGATGTPSGS